MSKGCRLNSRWFFCFVFLSFKYVVEQEGNSDQLKIKVEILVVQIQWSTKGRRGQEKYL